MSNLPTPIKNILTDPATIQQAEEALKGFLGWLIKKFKDGSFRPFLRKRVDKHEQMIAALIRYIQIRDGHTIDIEALTAQVMKADYSIGEPLENESV